MKSLLKLITAIAVMLGGMAFAAPAANAETITAEAHATSMDEVSVSASLKTATVVNTNADGKIVGAWFKNPDAGNGKHWNPKKAKKVRFVKSYNKGAASCKPFRLKKGKWYPRTLKMRDGTPFQVKGGRRVQHAWALFDVGANCQIRHRGFWNGKRWIGDCVNPKPAPNWPVVPPSMVVEVKQHTSIDYALNLDWEASAWVYGSVSVDCGGGNTSTASFKAKGSVVGSATLKISARSRTEAEAKARQKIELDVKNSTSIKASIMGDGEASAEGSATASCSSGENPEDNPPVIVDLTRINDLNVSWEMEICAKADFDKSHGGTLLFSFTSGGIKGTNPVQVADLQEGCVTLVAPSEPGTYTYKVTATDAVTGKSVTVTSEPFTVNPEPTIPG
jgi:hypothetical protein